MSVEAWLRGPVEGIPADVMPIAHALVQALEDVRSGAGELGSEALRARPGGAASIGWHLTHLAGSTDRLFTYARGDALSSDQRAVLDLERTGGDVDPGASDLIRDFEVIVETCLSELRDLDVTKLDEFRGVGAKQLPTTVRGLLSHAAEHAARHTGQIMTTLKVLG